MMKNVITGASASFGDGGKLDDTLYGIVVECERITLTRGTGSVTCSTAGKLGMLGPGGQHVCQAFKQQKRHKILVKVGRS